MKKKEKSLSIGGVYYLTYNVLNLAFPLVTGIYVARTLLSTNIGEVGAAINLATYFTILAFLGIPTYGLREIAKVKGYKEQRSKIFSELFTINLVSTVVSCVLYFFVILTIPKYNNNFKLYAIAGTAIVLNVFNISWMYEGMEEFRFMSIRNIVFKAFSFLLLVVFVREQCHYMRYAAITVLGTAGNYIVNMLYSPRFVRLSFQNLNLGRHMKSIIYLVTVNLAIELYSLVDITMMNFMSRPESIAYYKYGSAIEKMLLQIVNTFTMVLVPRISFYYKEKKLNEFNHLVSKGMKLIILTAVPMIIGIQFVSDFLITELYGAEYATSATILRMFSVLLLISPTGYLLGSRILLVTNHERKMIICVGIGAVINLIGNALLIPKLNEYGATIASVISEIVVMVVYVYFGKQYFKLNGLLQTCLKVFVAAILMFLFLLGSSLLHIDGWILLGIKVAGAALIYSSSLVLTREEIVCQYTEKVRHRIHNIFVREQC